MSLSQVVTQCANALMRWVSAESGGDFFGERDDEVPTEGVGDPGEGIDAVAGPSALLEARNDRLRGSHPLGQLALADPGSRTEVVDFTSSQRE